MESIFNSKSGVPHIGEKILKCMDIKSIVNCSSVNQGLRSYMENYIDNLNPMDFFKRVKLFLLKEVSPTNEIPQLYSQGFNMKRYEEIKKKNIQGLWLPLIEIIDENKLWNHQVKQQVYLCMIRILDQENRFCRISSFMCYFFSSWNMDLILDSAIGKRHAFKNRTSSCCNFQFREKKTVIIIGFFFVKCICK